MFYIVAPDIGRKCFSMIEPISCSCRKPHAVSFNGAKENNSFTGTAMPEVNTRAGYAETIKAVEATKANFTVGNNLNISV